MYDSPIFKAYLIKFIVSFLQLKLTKF